MAAKTRRKKSLSRRTAVSLAILLAFFFIFYAAGEALIRHLRPPPRTQVVSDEYLEYLDGVPIWCYEKNYDDRRRNLSCLQNKGDEQAVVLGLGSSRLYGDQLAPGEVYGSVLQELLTSAGLKGVCMLNFAIGGYHFQQSFALARKIIPEYKPRVVIWEIATDQMMDYTVFGKETFDLSTFKRDGAGYPALPFIPAPVSHLLFRHSKLFQYFAISTADKTDDDFTETGWRRRVATELPELLSIAGRFGGELVFVQVPSADADFSAPEKAIGRYETFLKFAEANKLKVVLLERVFHGREFFEVFLKDRAHLNPKGQRLLAEALFPIVNEILVRKPASPPSTPR